MLVLNQISQINNLIQQIKKEANHDIHLSIKQLINNNLNIINSLIPDNNDIEKVIGRLEKIKPIIEEFILNGVTDEISKTKNLRKIVYLLDNKELINPTILNRNEGFYIIDLIEKYWKDSFLYPLSLILLRSYQTADFSKPIYKKIIRVVDNKLANYHGARPFFNFLKENDIKFSNIENSINNIIKTLKTLSESFTEWSQISRIPEYVLSTNFFTTIKILYCGTQKNIKKILGDDNGEKYFNADNQSAKKLLTAKLITSFNKEESYQSILTSIAFKNIGDPAISSNWKIIDGSFPNYIDLLGNAQRIIHSWINKRIIDYFFETAEMDSGRKAFWKQYAEKFNTIQIALHSLSHLRVNTQNNDEFASWIHHRQIRVLKETTDIALIMHFNEWVIVEIGSHGNACYLYHESNKKIISLNNKSIYNLAILKDTSMPILHVGDLNKEGRMIHYNGWQYHFRNILNNKIGLRP